MLQTQNLTFTYDGNTVLQFPDIHCRKGEQWLLLGQSGSGKTTLLHLLGGLRTPRQGDVQVAGTSLGQLRSSELDRFRGQHIGIVFQTSHFVRALNVEENLMLAQQLAGQIPSRPRIEELLSRLNISHKLSAMTDSLSQGEQQRLAIARALINRPGLILADEPTSALDDKNCDEVIQLLEGQAREEEATLLIVTHDGRLKDKFQHKIVLEDKITRL
ncbi:MAG: ATP-binding cassette domain-containing protein [Bacteroidota bacterium]